MHISFKNQDDLSWGIATAALFSISLAAFVFYAMPSDAVVSGGSIPGLIFGISGYLLMVFAVLLSVRKRLFTSRWVRLPMRPLWRAQNWMRGHLWMGALSYVLILFHAGRHWGGRLTEALVLMFTWVVVTGIAGAVLQHYLPGIMTNRVPPETVYGEIGLIQGKLVIDAEELKKQLEDVKKAPTEPKAATKKIAALEEFKTTYGNDISPFLAARKGQAKRERLSNQRASEDVFSKLREKLPDSIGTLNDLEKICNEKRDLDRQLWLHPFFYCWLLAHIPFSFLVVILGAFHAWKALHYN